MNTNMGDYILKHLDLESVDMAVEAEWDEAK